MAKKNKYVIKHVKTELDPSLSLELKEYLKDFEVEIRLQISDAYDHVIIDENFQYPITNMVAAMERFIRLRSVYSKAHVKAYITLAVVKYGFLPIFIDEYVC